VLDLNALALDAESATLGVTERFPGRKLPLLPDVPQLDGTRAPTS
jgi:hypothetical protein